MNQLLFIYNPISVTGRIKEALVPILDVFAKAGWLTTA